MVSLTDALRAFAASIFSETSETWRDMRSMLSWVFFSSSLAASICCGLECVCGCGLWVWCGVGCGVVWSCVCVVCVWCGVRVSVVWCGVVRVVWCGVVCAWCVVCGEWCVVCGVWWCVWCVVWCVVGWGGVGWWCVVGWVGRGSAIFSAGVFGGICFLPSEKIVHLQVAKNKKRPGERSFEI